MIYKEATLKHTNKLCPCRVTIQPRDPTTCMTEKLGRLEGIKRLKGIGGAKKPANIGFLQRCHFYFIRLEVHLFVDEHHRADAREKGIFEHGRVDQKNECRLYQNRDALSRRECSL